MAIALQTLIGTLRVLKITFIDGSIAQDFLIDQDRIDILRRREQVTYEAVSSELVTEITYDIRRYTRTDALYSLYTTLFIIVVLMVSTNALFILQ